MNKREVVKDILDMMMETPATTKVTSAFVCDLLEHMVPIVPLLDRHVDGVSDKTCIISTPLSEKQIAVYQLFTRTINENTNFKDFEVVQHLRYACLTPKYHVDFAERVVDALNARHLHPQDALHLRLINDQVPPMWIAPHGLLTWNVEEEPRVIWYLNHLLKDTQVDTNRPTAPGWACVKHKRGRHQIIRTGVAEPQGKANMAVHTEHGRIIIPYWAMFSNPDILHRIHKRSLL